MIFDTIFAGFGGFYYCMEMLIACMLFHVYLKKRKQFWLRILLCAALLFILSLLVYPLFHGEILWLSCIWYGFVYLMMIIVSRFCCNISWQDAIYCASCGYLVQHLASSVFILCIFNGSIPVWNGPVYYLVYLLVYALVFFTFARLLPDEGEYHVSWLTASMTSVVALSIVLLLSTYVKTTAPLTGDISSSEKYILLLKGSQVYAASICLVILILQVVQRRELRTQRMLDRNQNLWKQRQMQYQLQKENIDLINRKCHDLKHQVAALARTEGKSLQKEQFAAEVQDMIQVYDSDANSGNEALDTILMEKSLYCNLHGIEWTCVADGKLLDSLDVVDLFTLIGNALDNAVEGVERCPEGHLKSISVRIWKKDLFTVIDVENTCSGEVRFKNGLPVTSKGDTANHGFGVRSIRSVAEKYGGTVHIKNEDGLFILTVLLPVQ